MDYTEWKMQVDRELISLCGMSSDDLPDYSYANAFEQGRSAQATAKSAIKAAKEF